MNMQGAFHRKEKNYCMIENIYVSEEECTEVTTSNQNDGVVRDLTKTLDTKYKSRKSTFQTVPSKLGRRAHCENRGERGWMGGARSRRQE